MKTLIVSLILISTLTSCYGQTKKANDYPRLEKKNFNFEEVYNKYKNEQYIEQYIAYKTVQSYEDPTGNPRKEPLPWDMKPVNTNQILKLLDTRLTLDKSQYSLADNGITCITSVPETVSDAIHDRLTVKLLDYKLADKKGNDISLAPYSGVSLSYSSLFEENGVKYQRIVIKIYFEDETKTFSEITKGHINLAFNLASGFDKAELDKSQCGKTVSFDGVQVELIEMEHNTAHLKLSASAAKNADNWDFIPYQSKAPMDGNLSSVNYPIAFYEFARKNKGLTYSNFEKEATSNETAWKNTEGDRCLVLYFDCPLTSLYIYRPQYTSVEKRVDIK